MIDFGFLVLLGFSFLGISILAGVSKTSGTLDDFLGVFCITGSSTISYFRGIGSADLDLRLFFGFSSTGDLTILSTVVSYYF